MRLPTNIGLLLSVIISGCFARKVSSPLLSTQKNPDDITKFENIVLAVDPPKKESDRYVVDDVVEHLRKTGFFKEVGYKNKLKVVPELFLTSLERNGNNLFEGCSLGFEGEMITIGTVGLIPQICHRFHIISFQLSNLNKEESVHIRITYERESVMGWVTLIYNLSPEWTWMPQPQERKEIQVWKSALHQKESEILKLLR
jgi:hypothetical protein